jgi:hypothetical protein
MEENAMRKSFRNVCLLAPALAALLCASASGTVSLVLTNNTATPQVSTVSAGSSFSVVLELLSSAQTTGIDYFLQDRTYTSGAARFRIVSRTEITGGIYGPGDAFHTDAQVAAVPSANLTPRNGLDLGASLSDPTVPTPPGTYPISTYVISVSPTTPAGTYFIDSFSQGNFGWTDVGPNFNSHAFDQNASIEVNVVAPEPAGIAVLGAGGLLALCRRRRAIG